MTEADAVLESFTLLRCRDLDCCGAYRPTGQTAADIYTGAGCDVTPADYNVEFLTCDVCGTGGFKAIDGTIPLPGWTESELLS